MNITILAISTLIVLIVFGIPVATHPQWFNSVEEEIEEAKREGHIVTAKPVKIEHISKNRRDDIEEPHRYIVTYEYEYNGKTYKKKCKEHEKSQGRAIYIPNGDGILQPLHQRYRTQFPACSFGKQRQRQCRGCSSSRKLPEIPSKCSAGILYYTADGSVC